MQMLGENVVGTVMELGKHIRQQASQPLPAGDAEGSVFLDILGAKMVSFLIPLFQPAKSFREEYMGQADVSLGNIPGQVPKHHPRHGHDSH